MKHAPPPSAPARPATRWAPWLLVAATLVYFGWSSTRLGLDFDEMVQLNAMLGAPQPERASAPFDLYNFGHVEGVDVDRELSEVSRRLYTGELSWCQPPLPNVIHFLRPATSAALTLELAAFGFHFWAYHFLQALLLLGACALFVGLWRRASQAAGAAPPGYLLPLGIAALAWNPTHQELLGRFCTLHYLLAAVLALLAHHALLRTGQRPALWVPLAVGATALGLLASEASLQAHVLGASCLFLARRQLTRGARWGAVACGLVLAAYLMAYARGEFGASGHGYNGGGEGVGPLSPNVVNGALDLVAGTYLTRFRSWYGMLPMVGANAGAGRVALTLAAACLPVAYALARSRLRRRALPLLGAALVAALPVAAVGQPVLRILSLPALAFSLFLLAVGAEAGAELAVSRTRGARYAFAALVLASVVARLGAGAALLPQSLEEVGSRTRWVAARWWGDRRLPPVSEVRRSVRAAREHIGVREGPFQVLIASDATGTPFPFGPLLLEQNGLPPELGPWLFLSDLPEGAVEVSRPSAEVLQFRLTRAAQRVNEARYNLFALRQRCFVAAGTRIETSAGTLRVLEASAEAEPLAVELRLRSSERYVFWSMRQGKLARVELPDISHTADY